MLFFINRSVRTFLPVLSLYLLFLLFNEIEIEGAESQITDYAII